MNKEYQMNLVPDKLRLVLNDQFRYYYLSVLFILTMFFAGSTESRAQTSVVVSHLSDSTYGLCSFQQYHSFAFNGTATGYKLSDSVTASINFGDGSIATEKLRIWSNNFWGYVNHNYSLPGKYNVRVIVAGPDGKSDTLLKNNLVSIADSCGNIKGKVYIDGNGNCKFDGGEKILPYMNVNIMQAGKIVFYGFADSTGNYSFDVPVGSTYEIQLGNSVSFPVSCPVSGKYTVSSFPSAGNDFAINCTGSSFDLGLSLSGWGFRPGAKSNIYVCVNNKACNSKTGKLKIVIPSKITLLSEVNGKAYTMSGDTAIFNFSNVSYWKGECFTLQVSTSVSAAIGDSICLWAAVEAGLGDTDPVNNIKDDCWPVRNSWDPNDKQVRAQGLKANGDIPIQATEMTYTINFQNMGNDVAYDIFVLDTLDADLDISTLKINSSSHPMETNLFGNNVLRFTFNNIMLPDNKANEPKSHGFINYSIKTKAGLSVGSKIRNTAYIYFDFNSAIVTNTTVNTVASPLGIKEEANENNNLRVYPNPFAGSATIKYTLDQNSKVLLEVYNIVGEKVVDLENGIKSAGIYENMLNADNMNAGIYLLKLSIDGKVSAERIIVQE